MKGTQPMANQMADAQRDLIVQGKFAAQTQSTATNAKSRNRAAPLHIAGAALALSLVTACAPPPLPPPPPPPPVAEPEAVPYRPLPPGGAAYVMQMPGKTERGERITVNRDLSEDETVWHFRSAWNVAALNCTAARYDPVLSAYSAYIKDHARALRRVNDRIEAEYRRNARSRRAGIVAREQHMTSVYNFFALPPARARFCTAALDISNRHNITPQQDPIAFAKDNFTLLQQPFELFFEEYEQYQMMAARWDQQYGVQYGTSQPGWIAVQEARANGTPVPSVEDDPITTLADPSVEEIKVTDPETGAELPIVPVEENVVSQPVTQPVAQEPDTPGSD